MSITRTYGDIEFECDNCGDSIETHTDDFTDALNFAKGEGWSARPVDGVWKHFCDATCLEEGTSE
jgi:hypothetical protein